MKTILYFTCCLLIIKQTLAQDKLYKGLRVGAALPNISFGKLLDNKGKLHYEYNGNGHFSELKGKLIILDFWATYCAPCISGFEKLSKIQSLYGNEVQIFLVNPIQDEKEVSDWLERINKTRNDNIVPDNLPMIVDAKKLYELFPSHGEIGYHVWINQSGIVELRGIAENTDIKKVKEFLGGNKISFVRDNSKAYTGKTAYFNNSSERFPVFSSTFGRFDDINASAYGSYFGNVIDTVNSTLRNTYLNYSALQLYEFSLVEKSVEPNILVKEKFYLDSVDISLISQDPRLLGRDLTSDDFLRKFCYEQVVPTTLEELERKVLMGDDLNRYFEEVLRIKGQWEKRTVDSYELVSTKHTDLSNESITKTLTNSFKDDIMYYNYKGYTAYELFKEYFSILKKSSPWLLNNVIIDRSKNSSSLLSLSLPDPYTIKNFNDLTKVLKRSGFTLKNNRAQIEMFVISKIK